RHRRRAPALDRQRLLPGRPVPHRDRLPGVVLRHPDPLPGGLRRRAAEQAARALRPGVGARPLPAQPDGAVRRGLPQPAVRQPAARAGDLAHRARVGRGRLPRRLPRLQAAREGTGRGAMTQAAVSVENVSKRFRIYHERNQTLKSAIMRRRRALYEDFWALDDVTFDIPEGRTFALVGDNGSGKSTLLKCMAQILYPTSGNIRTRGRVAALLEVGSGFHPELSGRDNVYLNGSILGMTKPEIDAKFDDIVGFSGVEQ